VKSTASKSGDPGHDLIPYPAFHHKTLALTSTGDALVERIKPLAKKRDHARCWRGIGGFGALFKCPDATREPVLVSVVHRRCRRKLRLAFEWNMHDTWALTWSRHESTTWCKDAEPLFLDYFACGKLDVDTAA
jgi:phosphoribosylformylglycinamidine cyclo-ligase